MPTLHEELQAQFAQVLGAVLLPDDYTAPAIARVSGEAQAPTADAEVQAEVLRSAHMILEIERNADALQERINALSAKKAQAMKLSGMLRGDVTDMLVKSGIKNARDLDIAVSLRKSPDKLKLDADLDVLKAMHPEFVRVKEEIDKAAINKHYKSTGEIIDGAAIVDGGYTVQIKQ